ncbi:Radical S-adenosyl methionine domain-containing protein 1, mitochondrial [Waddlia chondrophila 2032/99]|uniref:Heme chaperone HemW n=2 Tax=Waddlia chondrophila TaxID=71667 RepID=D6YW32_WADCW|nr:radical SAM family heme chaperone HemW [Waddlia chondrophila]ADI38343.1 putative coproporphyrinogen III oxidase [Waddlia chondrophila WSU 86-1044]CCB91426.1 Radical S-adenosyl methionine domain-containing protein 1, mitochondrial [Waddlia chondrophila 2032/99]
MVGNSHYSIYVHIPLCTKKCDYCHFYVVPDKEPYHALLSEGLKLEWEAYRSHFQGRNLASVYFGGGTPSLFDPRSIEKILSFLPCCSATEITLEANPENLSEQRIREFADAGINRLSIGIQSLDDKQLELLTRGHGAQKAIDGIEAAFAAGIENISIDLMYDIPEQTLENWKETLRLAINLPITHLSLYNLTFEPHTVFFKHRERLKASLPSEETSASMYKTAVETLTANGFIQYEISAFCKPNRQSVHNSGYWTGREFIGLGPSAFSYWNGSRFRNIARLHQWHQALKEGKSPVDYSESLAPAAAQKEKLAIRLRLLEGVNLSEFKIDRETSDGIKRMIASELLALEKGVLRLTEKGILFYDTVATEII